MVTMNITIVLYVLTESNDHISDCVTLNFQLIKFAPVDTPSAVDSFLGYWKPNVIVLMESELWPNLIMAASEKGVSYLILLWIY